MKKMILLNTFFLALLGCEDFAMDYDYNRIEIRNNSHSLIGIYIADGIDNILYPDTLLPISNKYVNYDISKILSPRITLPKNQKSFFDSLPKDTLSIFIFSTNTLNKYSWEEVRRDYKILKRYDLSYEDCKLLKFRVPYPPTPAMSRMKMYPKYGK